MLQKIWTHFNISFCFYCFSSSEISSVSDEHNDKRSHIRCGHPGCHEHLLLHLLPHPCERQEQSCQQLVWSPQPRLELGNRTQLTGSNPPKVTELSLRKTVDVAWFLCISWIYKRLSAKWVCRKILQCVWCGLETEL